MKLHRITVLVALSLAASASFADTATSALDLSAGNARFGRDTATDSFFDTYTFTLGAPGYLVSATATSAASGSQDLDYTSLMIKNLADVTLATFAGNLGTDANEFYSLPSTFLPAGDYRLLIAGVNSLTQASYSGNMSISAVSAVPEPQSYALLLAGLGAIGFVARRREQDRRDI